MRAVAVAVSAVEHFDEGVYASNLYCGPPDYAYPFQALYAPPLVPALIETGLLAGLPPDLAALAPAWLAGSLTLGVLWWCGRQWVGPRGGLAVLTLAVCSDLHLLLSSAALTDGVLLCWVLLAVEAARRGVGRGDLRWAVAAGLCTGLAWWTKYNGWLPLAIVAAAAPLAWLLARGRGDLPLRFARVWLVMASVAAVVILPWLLSLQAIGGYQAVAANHARYVVGLFGWPESAGRHLAQQRQLQSFLAPLGIGLACLLAEAGPAHQPSSRVRTAGIALGAALAAWLVGLVPVLAGAAVSGLCRGGWALWRSEMPAGSDARAGRDERILAWSLTAAWWTGLLIATPCYTPYARLALGWVGGSWLAVGWLWSDMLRPLAVAGGRARWARTAWAGVGLAAAGIFAWHTLTPSGGRSDVSPSYLPRRGVRELAEVLRREWADAPRRVIYVYGDPALFFQLRAAGEELAAPAAQIPAQPARLADQPLPTYLVVGTYAQRDPAFQRQWSERAGDWERLARHAWHPSALVWLDWEDVRWKRRPSAAVEVYRWKALAREEHP